MPEGSFLEEVLKEVANILPEHEARLVYPSEGEFGPVSEGRTRKTGIAALKKLETLENTENNGSKRRIVLPMVMAD